MSLVFAFESSFKRIYVSLPASLIQIMQYFIERAVNKQVTGHSYSAMEITFEWINIQGNREHLYPN